MGDIIRLGNQREPKPPIIICSHCRQDILIDITNWKDDVTKVMQDKCPHCRGTLMSCVLILTDVDVRRLMRAVHVCVQAMQKGNIFTG